MSEIKTLSSELLIFEAHEFRSTFLKLLDSAKTAIFLESYIFENDDFGREVFSKLCEKAAQGVTVCLLVDGFGSVKFTQELKHQNPIRNMEVRVFHRLPFMHFNKSVLSELRDFQNLIKLCGAINRRNHKKVLIIDDQYALLGSRNVYDEALEWRETSVVISDERVKILLASFETDWRKSLRIFQRILWTLKHRRTYRPDEPVKDVLFSQSYAQKRYKLTFIQRKIAAAKQRILITTPYFNPPFPILRELLRAARRGVTVQVLLPAKSDVAASLVIARSFYGRLLAHGIEVFEYLPCVLHAKSIVVDDWAMVGSSNFNQRSFRRDLEADVAIRTMTVSRELCEQFQLDLSKSRRVESLNRTSWTVIWLLSKLLSLFTSSF